MQEQFCGRCHHNEEKETIVAHSRSHRHQLAEEAHRKGEMRASLQSSSDMPGSIEGGFRHMRDAEIETLQKLFRTALYLAMKERPFLDFKPLIELQHANGVNLMDIYRNDKQAQCKSLSLNSFVWIRDRTCKSHHLFRSFVTPARTRQQ